MPQVTVNGIELYYESHGAGDPLLLIGGLGLAVSEIQPLIKALAASQRVIAADNRGAGRSAKPPGPYTIGQMADDLAALMAHLGLRHTGVLGISMGGRIALSLALDHPGLADRLVLVSTGARAGGRRGRVRLGMAISRLPGLRGQNPQPPSALKAQFEASGSYDCTGRLGEIAQPTLIVHGRSDHIAPLALAQEMQARIPGASMVLLGGGHLISLLPQHRGQLVGAVREFLRPGEPGPGAAR